MELVHAHGMDISHVRAVQSIARCWGYGARGDFIWADGRNLDSGMVDSTPILKRLWIQKCRYYRKYQRDSAWHGTKYCW